MHASPDSAPQDEVRTIGERLQLRLPQDYVDTLVHYPFPADSPLAKVILYARPEQVIEKNRSARANGFFGHSWPEHFLIVGDFENGDLIFLDTTKEKGLVLIASHERTTVDGLVVESTGFELREWVSSVSAAWKQQQ